MHRSEGSIGTEPIGIGLTAWTARWSVLALQWIYSAGYWSGWRALLHLRYGFGWSMVLFHMTLGSHYGGPWFMRPGNPWQPMH
jgi:hypothetical protein